MILASSTSAAEEIARQVPAANVVETLAVLSQIVGLTQKADILDNVDLDGMIRAVAEANGTPRYLLRDTTYVDQVRAQRAEAQAALAEALDRLWADRAAAANLGRRGFERLRAMNLSWSYVVERLLE